MNKRLAVKLIDLYSIIVFFSCVEIPSIIRLIHGQRYLFYLRMVIIAILLVEVFVKKIKLNKLLPICLFSGWLIIATILSGHNVSYCLYVISMPFLMCLFFIVQKPIRRLRVLYVWKNILLIIVLIDFVTILLFKNGMYSDGLQSLNWFLGYKTARFVLELPLVLLNGYLNHIKKGKFGVSTYLLILIICFCLYRAEATASLVCSLLLGCLLIFLDKSQKFSSGRKIIYKVFNFKWILAIYAFIVVSVISIQSTPWVQTFVVNVLHKDATLTTRTFIWGEILLKIAERPLFGFGILDQETYVSITMNPFANSPHNMVLTVLMSGGLIGLLLYIYIFVKALRKKEGVYLDYQLLLVAGVIVSLIVGTTSEALLFSEYGLFIYLLMNMNYDERKKGIV